MTLENILWIAAALFLLELGESLKNETKQEYVKKGHSWSKVLFYSNSFALLSGILISVILHYQPVPSNLNPQFLPFAVTVVGYITTQSFMTDLKVLMINRNILRVAYMAMYVLSVYNVVESEVFRDNWVALVLFTVLLMLIFIFSSIGASDVRAMAVALPFVVSMGGYDAILMFMFTLIVVSICMEIRNRIRDKERMRKFKEDHKESYETMNRLLFYQLARDMIQKEKTEEQLATPVGPYMISPFFIFLIIYPFLLN